MGKKLGNPKKLIDYMKIIIPSDSKQSIGGGWSFKHNLEKGMRQIGHTIVEDINQADIALVAGPTMVLRETVNKIKQARVKLVVRVDNVPRNSRNRNTGTSRLKEFTQIADEVVWQCQWAKDYLIDFVGREGKIIYNGVDTNVFRPEGETFRFGDKNLVYLYSRYNRDETKNWEVAWYKFQLLFREDKRRKLVLVGQFSPEQIQFNFDFFRGEQVSYMGVIDNPEEMASLYRSCGYLLATYYNDCYSNTYQEAIACGCQLFEPDMSGGTPELIKNGVITLEQMARKYERVFEEVLSK